MEAAARAPRCGAVAESFRTYRRLHRVVYIGIGFFTTQLAWALYNAFLPTWLADTVGSHLLVGAVMTLDNLAMIFMEPSIGALSDRTASPIGRRLPFVLAGVPAAAVLLALLPHAAASVGLLVPLMVAFLLVMAFYRAPVVRAEHVPPATPGFAPSLASRSARRWPLCRTWFPARTARRPTPSST